MVLRAILATAEYWLPERGIENLHLMVRVGNVQAPRFYESLDYGVQKRAHLAVMALFDGTICFSDIFIH